MENASKALIIAGSILLAILIVAMGVRIFNGARNSADTTTLDSTEISMFNQKFEKFSGKQTGSSIKSLCSFAISNASTNGEDPSKLPTINYTKGATGDSAPAVSNDNGGSTASGNIQNYINIIGGIRNGIVTTHNYYVDISYGNSGLIQKITIKYDI